MHSASPPAGSTPTIHFEQMSYYAGMVLWAEVGANSRVDGDVRYRVTEHGTRVGILPTCKRGLHSLAETGYGHTDNDDENVLRITCPVCLAEPHPDHSWRLRTTPPAPAAAELDDSVYRDTESQFQARPIPPQPQGTRRVDERANQSTGSSPVGTSRQS